ncbi:MAG: SUMF1/EgtB/PvdO family nonheme iron enzyme [Kiritimatiellales bacterium]|nr:SUMF1/EgtB/PvdO family nonheme iron enzyme [Kiritimatiellales bacterium]
MKTKWLILAGLVGLCGMAQAAFVTIGNAGNTADGSTGYGAVGYTYQISATEVTIAEFMASDAGNGNEDYWNDGTRMVGASAPASFVSLYEAMKYCNYLTSGNVDDGAYVFSGGVYQSTDRASAITTYGKAYALPTIDEWYKAAYFKPDASGYSFYANGTDIAPSQTDANYGNEGGSAWAVGSGAVEQNGTFDMMGNVAEWLEYPEGDFTGGNYEDFWLLPGPGNTYPSMELSSFGFRVVEVNVVPEPATASLMALVAGIVFLIRRQLD